MMKFRSPAVVLLFLLLATVSFSAEMDESVPPPILFTLELQGKSFPIELNKPIKVPLELKNPEVILKADPHRTFGYGGFEFKYPYEYSFEAQLGDPQIKIWTLTGNNATVMVQGYKIVMDTKAFADLLVAQYGGEKCKIVPCKFKTQKAEMDGHKVIASFAGSTLTQEVFAFKTDDGSSLLILQDSVKDDGSASEEFTKLKNLIEKTFQQKAE